MLSFKKASLLLTFVFVYAVSLAQPTMNKEQMLKLMSDKVCAEFEKYPNKKWTSEQAQNTLVVSIMPVMLEYQSDIEKLFDASFDDSKSMERIGYQLGLVLMKECDAFKTAMLNGARGQDDKEEMTVEIKEDVAVSNEASASGKNVLTVFGKVSLNNTAIGSFEVTTEEGTRMTIWFFNSFEGVEKLTNKNFEGKRLRIGYSEKVIYDAKSKSNKVIYVAESLF